MTPEQEHEFRFLVRQERDHPGIHHPPVATIAMREIEQLRAVAETLARETVRLQAEVNRLRAAGDALAAHLARIVERSDDPGMARYPLNHAGDRAALAAWAAVRGEGGDAGEDGAEAARRDSQAPPAVSAPREGGPPP